MTTLFTLWEPGEESSAWDQFGPTPDPGNRASVHSLGDCAQETVHSRSLLRTSRSLLLLYTLK
jgi:hypothetical protein